MITVDIASYWFVIYIACSRSDQIKQYHDNSCSTVLEMIRWYIHTVCIAWNDMVRYGTASSNITDLSPQTNETFPPRNVFSGFCWRFSLFSGVEWKEIRTPNHQSNHEVRHPNTAAKWPLLLTLTCPSNSWDVRQGSKLRVPFPKCRSPIGLGYPCQALRWNQEEKCLAKIKGGISKSAWPNWVPLKWFWTLAIVWGFGWWTTPKFCNYYLKNTHVIFCTSKPSMCDQSFYC